MNLGREKFIKEVWKWKIGREIDLQWIKDLSICRNKNFCFNFIMKN